MTLTTVFVILFGHWVADFVFQTDEMAQNKSSSNFWLTQHVLAYTICMAFVGGFIFRDLIHGDDREFAIALVSWLLVNLKLHWITDYTTSRINSYLWRNERRHDFFVMIGADQLIHYTCLFATDT